MIPAPRQSQLAERTAFAGRAQEQATLRRHLDAALGGRGSLVMIGGEPGIGKTRIAEEIATAGVERGMAFHIGHTYEVEGALPYVSLVEILEAAMESADPVIFRQVLGEDAGEVARIVPGIRRAYDDVPAPVRLPAEQERRYLFNAIREVLARAAAITPMVMLLDDLQWADEPTLLLIQHLAQAVDSLPILILGTYRDTDLDVGRPLARVLDDLVRGRRAVRLALKRLPENDVAEMLTGMANQAPPKPLVKAIYHETEGNPFFVEEVFRHLAEEGRLFDARGRYKAALKITDLDIPEGVRLAIGRRLQHLTETSRRVLTAAAVIGRSFGFRLLANLSEEGEDDVLEAIEEAERARLIVPVPGAEARYRFAHELVRQTLASGLSLPRQQRLHARAAAALELAYPDGADEHAAEIAHHLYQAGEVADPQKTYRFLTLAAQQALEASAFEDAHRHLERVASLPHLDERNEAAVLRQLARAHRCLGEWDEALANWNQAMEIYERLGDHAAIGEICKELVEHLVWGGRWPEALAVANRGLDAIGGDHNSPDSSHLLGFGGLVLGLSGDYEGGRAMLDRALGVYRSQNGPDVDPRFLIFDSILKFGYGQLNEALEVGRRALEAFRKSHALWDEATLLGFMCTALFNTGQYDDAERMAQHTYQLGERVGNYGALWFANMILSGHAMLIDGDLERYEAMVDREKVIAPRAGFVFMGEAATHQGMVKFHRGEWEAALACFEEGADLEMPGAFGGNSSLVPLCLAYLGRREEALRKLVAERAKLPNSGGPITLTHLSAAAGMVETLTILGERQQAAALHEISDETRRRGLSCSHFTGRTTALLGAITAAAGDDWDKAEELFGEAAREADAVPLRGARPDIRRFHAMALLDRGEPADRKRAIELLERAVAEYRQIGMQRHVKLAEELLVKAGGAVSVKPAGESRFKREGDVWTIAFDGHVTRVKHGVGLAYLAHLLARPGTEVHVMDLVGAVEGTGAAPRAAAPAASEREAAGINTDHTYEAVLDATARNAYKSRLRELQAEIERAERDNDPERASRARTEFDFLASELTGAMGLGGRARTSGGSSAERARVSVTKAVKAALKRIDAQHPALGQHLERTIHTGAFCAYTPDPRAPIDWVL